MHLSNTYLINRILIGCNQKSLRRSCVSVWLASWRYIHICAHTLHTLWFFATFDVFSIDVDSISILYSTFPASFTYNQATLSLCMVCVRVCLWVLTDVCAGGYLHTRLFIYAKHLNANYNERASKFENFLTHAHKTHTHKRSSM